MPAHMATTTIARQDKGAVHHHGVAVIKQVRRLLAEDDDDPSCTDSANTCVELHACCMQKLLQQAAELHSCKRQSQHAHL